MTVVDKPYAGGRWSEAKMKSFVRSTLRRAFLRWPVRSDALTAARRPQQGRSARTKWEYCCASCGGWFLGSEVQVDHIIPAGSLDDVTQFVGRLFCEEDGLQILCAGCHQCKTNR